MFSKGNTMFQGKVKHEAKSIKDLLVYVPDYLGKMKDEIVASIESESFEVEEWNYETGKYEKTIWIPPYDFGFVDYMLDVFYSSLLVRIYSFAENGLKNLSGIRTKPKCPKGQTIQKYPSDIDLYYQEIGKKYDLDLPPIESLWPNKENFHDIRKQITHHGKTNLSKEEVNHLATDLDDALNMLCFVEEKIRETNPTFIPS